MTILCFNAEDLVTHNPPILRNTEGKNAKVPDSAELGHPCRPDPGRIF